MSIEARQLARLSTTMDISNWRACADFTRRSNPETASRGLSFDYHCMKGYSNVFELGKFWAPDEEDIRILAETGADTSASPLVRAQALSTRGFLLASEGNIVAASADYRTALFVAQGAVDEQRQEMQWLMSSENGVPTGTLIDNVISEVSRRLEMLELAPLVTPSTMEEKVRYGAKLIDAGLWRTGADMLQRAYETAQPWEMKELGQGAFTAYVDTFRSAGVPPCSEDVEFLERVASDPHAPSLARAQAWTLTGLVAWSQGRPDTATWHLDEGIMQARASLPADWEREAVFVDTVYGGFRNVSLGRMLESVTEDALADKSLLTVTGPIAAFQGLESHVFAPQDRALMHQGASSSNVQQQQLPRQPVDSKNSVSSLLASFVMLLVLLMLIVPVAYSLVKNLRKRVKRWWPMLCDMIQQYRDRSLQKSKANPSFKNKSKSPAPSRKQTSPATSKAGARRRVTTADSNKPSPIVCLPKDAGKQFSEPHFDTVAAAITAAGACSSDDDETGKCKVCFDAPCEMGFFHGGSVHTGICGECAEFVMESARPLCPFCRSPIEACVQIFS